MGNIYGLRDPHSKVTLNRVIGMVMASGNRKTARNSTKAIIYLIESMDTASMIGGTILSIKGNI